MPGKVIGTEFNPASESVWEARILIRKKGSEYGVEYHVEKGDEKVSRLIHEHLQGVIERLNQALK